MTQPLLSLAMATLMQVGGPAPHETPNYPPINQAFSQHGFEGQYEQRFPFDSQQNWVKGYSQEIPAYGGHVFYRPYNYKDVYSQSQTAAGWGMPATTGYSQQFWHKYHDQATMMKVSSIPQGYAPSYVRSTPVWSAPVNAPWGAAPGTIQLSGHSSNGR